MIDDDSLEIKDRAFMMKMHGMCFLGSDAFRYIKMNDLKGLAVRTDEDALFLGNALMRCGIIKAVPQKSDDRFEDKPTFYRFLAHERAGAADVSVRRRLSGLFSVVSVRMRISEWRLHLRTPL